MANETNKSSDESPKQSKQLVEAGDQTPASPNWAEADKKVASIQEQLNATKGKVGHNPFLWMNYNSWDYIVAGIKARQLESLEKLNKLPNTIDTTIKSGPLGPLTVETPTKK